MNSKLVLSAKIYFSYSQFMVFDSSVQMPACDWTAEHGAQGFAKREATVNFSTLLEFGHADVNVFFGVYEPLQEYQRVISVPFLTDSGTAFVEGLDETPNERGFKVPPGNYRLISAQKVTSDETELIDLFFERTEQPLKKSIILVADDMIAPPNPLLETAEIAGES